jgi:hypothetical protein
MERNSDYYYKEAKKYNKRSKEALKSNDKKLSVFYKNKVKEYLDLYNTKVIQEKQLEQKKEEQEKLEKQLDALEKENQIKDKEQEILEKERLEKERLEKERLEKERLERERLEKERLEQERLEQERLEKERLEQERLIKERLEQERLIKERLEQERLEQERLEQERLEQERLEQERLEQERLDKIKYKQQRKNLKRREKIYKKKTGEDYHPLVVDDEDKNDNILIPQDITPQNVVQLTSSQQNPLSIVSPPKSNPINKKTIKKTKMPKLTPIEMTNLSKSKMNATKKIQKSGFTETLKKTNAIVQQKLKPLPNSTICQNIFMDGSKTNNKYFYPSEFPKLTKIKPITILTKKGGKNNKRKTFKKKYKK